MKLVYSVNPNRLVIKFLSHNVNAKAAAELTNTIKARRLTSKGRIKSVKLVGTTNIR